VTALADLSITKSGPATVAAGGTITYSLDVANAGPSNAANLTVTDTLPAGVTFVSAGGAGWTCTHVGSTSISCTRATLATASAAPTITVVVTAPAEAASLSNTASVSSTTADPDPTNNSSTVPTGVTASADLSIVKTGPAHVDSGGTITYTLTVSNAGPSAAADLTVTDTLPGVVTFVSATGTGWTCSTAFPTVTCTSTALASGASTTIAVVVTAPVGSTALLNTATVGSTTPDPTPSNNTSSAPTQVAGSADLSIVKTGPASVTAGTNVAYTIAVSNAGPDDAVSVVMVDTLPPGVTFVSVSGAGWTCTHAGNVSVTCTRPVLTSGANAPLISLVVTAPATAGPLVNRATVASSTTDPTPANNASAAPVVVLAAPPGGGGGGSNGGDGGNGGNGGSNGGNGGHHPQTGADVPGELTWALALLVAGLLLLLVVPRRRPRS
jgi:large repetitive protein